MKVCPVLKSDLGTGCAPISGGVGLARPCLQPLILKILKLPTGRVRAGEFRPLGIGNGTVSISLILVSDRYGRPPYKRVVADAGLVPAAGHQAHEVAGPGPGPGLQPPLGFETPEPALDAVGGSGGVRVLATHSVVPVGHEVPGSLRTSGSRRTHPCATACHSPGSSGPDCRGPGRCRHPLQHLPDAPDPAAGRAPGPLDLARPSRGPVPPADRCRRGMHVGVTRPDPGSPRPCLAVKAHLQGSGLSHAIRRPSLFFGASAILRNMPCAASRFSAGRGRPAVASGRSTRAIGPGPGSGTAEWTKTVCPTPVVRSRTPATNRGRGWARGWPPCRVEPLPMAACG